MSRILVVEDSPSQAHLLTRILKEEGFLVQVASDGQQGLERCQRDELDLVITDVLMPGMTGYELCREIKSDPVRRHLPVILLTSLSDPIDIIHGIACGADHFIPKPYDAESLIDRIKSLLANLALRAQSKVKIGIEAMFLGQTFTITSDKEQILDLLLSTCEDIVRTNRELRDSQNELRSAKARVEQVNEQLAGQVRLSEEKYHTLMEGANDAIFLLDPEGRVLEANRRAEDLLGQPRSGVHGRRFEEFMPSAELHEEREKFRQLLASGTARADNVHLARSDGQLVSVDWSASVVMVGDQRMVLAIVRDTTERIRLEQQLNQAQKMEAVGRLAGGVAHDFNNLLTVINGFSEMVQSRLRKEDPLHPLVGEILKAGERASSLTRRLLAFSRQQVIAPRVLDLNVILADTEKLLRRLIGEDIELITKPTPNVGRVKADPGQIEQVILNLAVNARDAMPTGGKLRIATQNVAFPEAGSPLPGDVRPGRYTLLIVSDTGSGIDETTRARLFEPFFTTKAPGKGTGLGLATVYGIVKQSAGFIEVDSVVGQGATFRIYLPHVEEAVSPGRASTVPPRKRTGTETILLVEDEKSVRELAVLALRLSGYTVLEASTVDVALRLSKEHKAPIHLLATDVVMPGMGGRALADRLTEQRPDMKVLFLSGYTNDAVVRYGVLHQSTHFLQKPFTGTALAQKVREVLDTRAGLPTAPTTP